MTLGKRGRPSGTITFNVGASEAEASPPPATVTVVETTNVLWSCGLCHRPLPPGRVMYMYRGDAAFCSLECREQQMNQDERRKQPSAGAGGCRR